MADVPPVRTPTPHPLSDDLPLPHPDRRHCEPPVHPADRIAAYLAGELNDADRRAFEDDLARDPRLREQLAAIERADAALSSHAPTALPDGAADRLRAALDGELAAALEGAPPATAGPDEAADAPPGEPGATFTATSTTDELGERRRRRGVPWTAIGGVAAAVVAVAVIAIGPLGLGPGDDGPLATFDDSADAPVMERGDVAEDAGAFAGPVLRGTDRPLDVDGAAALLDDPQVRELAAASLEDDDGRRLAATHAAAFGVDLATASPSIASDQAPTDDAGDLEDEATPEADDGPRAVLRTEGTVDPEIRQDVARCLDVLLAGGGEPVPVGAETVVFEGEEAVAFTLVGRDAAGALTRPEVWVLSRADCEVRHFAQR